MVADGTCTVHYGEDGRVHLDVHHIETRGSGGDDDVKNMICLCRKHHQMAGNGLISKKYMREILEERYGYDYT
jgi:predicted restriction endonuclease